MEKGIKGRWKTRDIFLIVLLLAVMAAAYFYYTMDYYHAEEAAMAVISAPAEGVEVEQQSKALVFHPQQPKAGLVFYPGGKVGFESYAPLMQALAERDILCVAVKMPGNLAVMKPDAAKGIPEQYPEVERWYLGGHSLGGVMAASYLEKHPEDFEGLVLLGAYSVADLSGTELKALSIYGSEDGVLDMAKYGENRKNLPDDTTELVLEGGCHSYFGDYGMQEGDGTPTMTREEQMEETAEAIAALVFEEVGEKAA